MGMELVRKQTYLTVEQDRWLKELAERHPPLQETPPIVEAVRS